jgi:hypothetical protein
MTLSAVFPASVVALPSHPEKCLARGGPQCGMRDCAKRSMASLSAERGEIRNPYPLPPSL